MSRLPVILTRKTVLVSFTLWNLWTLFYTVILIIAVKLPFAIALLSGIISYYPLAFLSIPILIFCKRYPVDTHPVLIFALIHFLAALLFSAIWLFVDYFINWLIIQERVFLYRPLMTVGIFSYYIGVLIYILLAGIFYTSETYKRYREKELKAAELQVLSREAELKALKAQINPHFLFNTLNSIFALIDSNTKKAKNILTRLSSLIRYSLAAFNREYVNLADEIDSVKLYLDIEKERFNERLTVHYQIDQNILGYKIPPMILQPLAENAVKHGISVLKEGGFIRISVKKEENGIKIQIENSCRKITKTGSEKHNGIGLNNLNKRLEKIYEDGFSLKYEYKKDERFEIVLILKNIL